MKFGDWYLLTEEFNPKVLDYYSNNIYYLLRSPHMHLPDLEDTLYNLLTTKTKDPHVGFLNKYQKQYAETIQMLQFPNYNKLAKGNGWAYFTPQKASPPKIGVGEAGKYVYGVDFKRYATFSSRFLDNNPSMPPEAFVHAWQEVRSFLGMLGGLAKRLWDLGNELNDYFQFKVNDNLRGLLEHVDNIVVHYTGPNNGPKVEEILRESARECGVKLDGRRQRGWKGFDLSPYGNVGNSAIKDGVSYSQMVAKRLAKEMVANRQQLTDKNRVSAFLIKSVPELLNIGPTPMVTYFHS